MGCLTALGIVCFRHEKCGNPRHLGGRFVFKIVTAVVVFDQHFLTL